MQCHVIELEIVREEQDPQDYVSHVLAVLSKLYQAVVALVRVHHRQNIGLRGQLVVVKI